MKFVTKISGGAQVFVGCLAAGLFVFSAGRVLAWTGPTAAPATPNAPAPINVSAVLQTKVGPFTVGSPFTVNNMATPPAAVVTVSTAGDMTSSGNLTANGATLNTTLLIKNTATAANALTITSGGMSVPVGAVTAQSFLYSSDRTLKKNILPLQDVLAGLDRLQPVTFTWKNNNTNDAGVIAQDLEKVYPDLVVTNPTTGLKSVKYNGIVAVLVGSVQELQKKNQRLLEFPQ